MRHTTLLSLCLTSFGLHAVLNADASEALAVSISIPAQAATAKKQPRAWRSNYPKWWLLKPKGTHIIDVYFSEAKLWEGFRRPAKDSVLKLNVTAIFEIPADEWTREHQIWNGKILSAPLEITFHN